MNIPVFAKLHADDQHEAKTLADAVDDIDSGEDAELAPPAADLVGLSLSKCVADLIDRPELLSRVRKIMTNTMCLDEEHFRDVCDYYSKTYWKKNPDWAKLQAMALWHSGRIYQPRTENRRHQMPTGNDSFGTLPSRWWIHNLDYRKVLTGKLRDLARQLREGRE